MRPLLRSSAWLLWLSAAGLGCGPLELSRGPSDAGSPDASEPAIVLTEAGTLVSGAFPAGSVPKVAFDSPAAGSRVAGASVKIMGHASDDFGVASVMLRSGGNSQVLATSHDGFKTFEADLPPLPGTFVVEAIAFDLAGQASLPEHLQLIGGDSGADTAAPTLRITAPADGSSPLQLLTLVEGEAEDDLLVDSMSVTRNGERLDERLFGTSDNFRHWSRLVPLLPGELNALVFTARDRAGHETQASLSLRARANTDREPPVVTLTAPTAALALDAERLDVRGTATDNVAVREVKVRLLTKVGTETVRGDYVAAATSDGFASFSVSIPIPSGAFTLEVRAIDLNGLSASQTLDLTNARIAPFAAEVAIPLRLKEGETPAPLRFSLDKSGIDQVFTADIQRDIRLLELDTTALVTDAVTQIKTSCGTLWRADNPDPRHDCSATSYGKDRTPQVPWQRTPEYAMVRLLTMTPANVVVAGTSLENLQGLADGLGIGGGFHSILADTMGIPSTREIVTTPSVVTALREYWMGTHPEVLPGAKMPVSLYDGMHDLEPLAERFGPSGTHPGLLDPAFPTKSQVLGTDFRMELVAQSNLRWFDGVDLSGDKQTTSKEYIAMIVDTTGDTRDDVLEFDFTDPAKFDILGIAAQPRVDMRMLMRENASFVRSCTTLANGGCKKNLPSTPINGYVWTNPKHQIESVVAKAAYEDYKSRTNYSKTYSLLGLPAAVVTVGASGNPAGYSTFETLLSLGDPPPPQYLWETILEVAQVALHKVGTATFAEGGVNVAFTLKNVDVGLTAAGIRSAIRPQMQAQRHKLSDLLLGDYARNSGAVDFYYRRDAEGKPALFFVSASDPRPGSGYTYAHPGFFADAALSQKLSVAGTLPEGGGNHEKLLLSAGETTVYAQDDAGQVYRLRIVVGTTPDEITLYASKKVL